ncbi:MAG: NAD(P)H-hydrate dehydratase [Ignavibacteriaceae bacterium]|jgi:NAD(P)H-hydrate epimerase
MIPLFSNKEVRTVDSYAIEQLGFPSLLLMENAASSLFSIISEKGFLSKTPTSVGILCGKGNNGGDGFALARKIAFAGHKVTVLHLSDKKNLSPDAAINYELLLKSSSVYKNIKIKKIENMRDVNLLRSCDFIVDAILGSGTQGELKSDLKKNVEAVNKFHAKKIAVDVPTGLNVDTGYGETIFKADLTISLGELKRGLFFGEGYLASGLVEKGNIGLGGRYFVDTETKDFLVEQSDIKSFVPVKSRRLNKYSAGKVFLLTGSKGFGGAAVLSTTGAFRSGAGAVILAIPNTLQKIILMKRPETVLNFYGERTTEFLALDHYTSLREKINWADSIAIGSGIGREEATIEFVNLLLKNHPNKKVIIDADAIYAVARNGYHNYHFKNAVFTPHLGEFCTLIGEEKTTVEKDLLYFGKKFVKVTKSILVLKGPRTIIFTPDGKSFINPTGNEGLAKFGSGDVLTGMLASFIAQIKDVKQAVLSAVYMHGLAADHLKEKKSAYGFTASDLAAQIPFTLKGLNDTL